MSRRSPLTLVHHQPSHSPSQSPTPSPVPSGGEEKSNPSSSLTPRSPKSGSRSSTSLKPVIQSMDDPAFVSRLPVNPQPHSNRFSKPLIPPLNIRTPQPVRRRVTRDSRSNSSNAHFSPAALESLAVSDSLVQPPVNFAAEEKSPFELSDLAFETESTDLGTAGRAEFSETEFEAKQRNLPSDEANNKYSIPAVPQPRVEARLEWNKRKFGNSVLFEEEKAFWTRQGSSGSNSAREDYFTLDKLIRGELLMGNDFTGVAMESGVNSSSTSVDHFNFYLSLPIWTRWLRYFLISIGVTRLDFGAELTEKVEKLGRSLQFSDFLDNRNLVIAYLQPAAIFAFFLFNIFYVAAAVQFQNKSTDNRDSGLKIIAQICTNSAGLLAWLGAFVYLGINPIRSAQVFRMLKNLEILRPKLVKFHVLGSLLLGFLFVAISLGTLPSWSFVTGVGDFFVSLNLAAFLLLNYLIVSFVVLCLSSLVCKFHSLSLELYQDQLFDHSLTVEEAIREHSSITRLMRNSNEFLQWMIATPLLANISGFLVMSYLMLITADYSSVGSALEQLLLALLLLLMPLHAGAAITSVSTQIASLCQEVDMFETLNERNSLIQQLVLIDNGFQLFEITLTNSRVAKLFMAVLAFIIVLIRGAVFQDTQNS